MENTEKDNTGKFCAGNKPWNKEINGYEINYPEIRKTKLFLSTSHKEAISAAVPKGEHHFCWKGESVKKRALHEWVEKELGKPNRCVHCGTEKAKRFEWANKSGKYLRNICDWLRLCTSCHRLYDNGKIII